MTMADNTNDVNELNDEALSSVSGGAFDSKGNIVAFCKSCKMRVKYLKTTRIGGATVSLFKCANKRCKEFDKQKDDTQVIL